MARSIIFVVALLFSFTSAAKEYIINGGFDNAKNPFAGWTRSGSDGYVIDIIRPGGYDSRAAAALVAPAAVNGTPGNATLTQKFRGPPPSSAIVAVYGTFGPVIRGPPFVSTIRGSQLIPSTPTFYIGPPVVYPQIYVSLNGKPVAPPPKIESSDEIPYPGEYHPVIVQTRSGKSKTNTLTITIINTNDYALGGAVDDFSIQLLQ